MRHYEILPKVSGEGEMLQCRHCMFIAYGLEPRVQMREHLAERHNPIRPTVWDTIQEPEPDIGDWREFREPVSEWRPADRP